MCRMSRNEATRKGASNMRPRDTIEAVRMVGRKSMGKYLI